jgi:hypothetical protein
MPMSTATHQFATLAAGLQQLRSGSLTASALSHLARAQTTLLAALPPNFSVVLQQLLDRLESSALFSEESCSFSQKDLLDSLQQWLDHAQRHLDKEVSP